MQDIHTQTTRGILLDGALFRSGSADTALIAITGIHGNFYSNPFIIITATHSMRPASISSMPKLAMPLAPFEPVFLSEMVVRDTACHTGSDALPYFR